MNWFKALLYLGILAAFGLGLWILRSRRAQKPRSIIHRNPNPRKKGGARPPSEDEKPVFYGDSAHTEAERLAKNVGVTGVLHYYPPSVGANDDGFEMFLIGSELPEWYMMKLKLAEYLRHFRPMGRDDQLGLARWLNEISDQMRLLAAQAHAQAMTITELPEFYAAALDFLCRNYGPSVARQKAVLGLTYAVGSGNQQKGTVILTSAVIPLITNYLASWSPTAQRKRRPTVGSMRAVADQIHSAETSSASPQLSESLLEDMRDKPRRRVQQPQIEEVKTSVSARPPQQRR